MTSIRLQTIIRAPVERCFDLSCSIEFHQSTWSHTEEKAIAGVTHGLIGKGEWVTWSAVHFGIRQTLTTEITEMERPHYFVDEMREGIFKFMKHHHYFEVTTEGTRMTDVFNYGVPFGIAGVAFDKLVLRRYMRRLLEKRNNAIRRAAESSAGNSFLDLAR